MTPPPPGPAFLHQLPVQCSAGHNTTDNQWWVTFSSFDTIIDSDNSSAAEEVTFIRQLIVQTMQLPIIDRKCPCKACDDNKSDATQTISLTFYFKTPIVYWDSLCVDILSQCIVLVDRKLLSLSWSLQLSGHLGNLPRPCPGPILAAHHSHPPVTRPV